MEVLSQLQRTISEHGQITIIYNGGSAPGAARLISPIEIRGDSLIARCHETNTRKTFKLAKIDLATTQPITPYQVEDRSAWTFSQHCADIRPLLESKGWSVTEGADSLQIFRVFKNGSPRKTPSASITFSEFTQTSEYDWASREQTVTQTLSTSPWKVFGGDKAGATRSFKHLDRAFAAFRETVSDMKP